LIVSKPSSCTSILRAPVALWVKKQSAQALNLFILNSEPAERIGSGNFTDSNFEDDRQPEIAIWPPKPEVLVSAKV